MLIAAFLWLSCLSFGLAPQDIAVTPVRGVRLPGANLSLPSIQERVLPKYPDGSAVRGFVDMEVVIGENGGVAHARVSKSLSDDLDREALSAARTFRFSPASDSRGNPFAMLMVLRMQFAPPTEVGGAGTVSADLRQPPRFIPPAVDLYATAIEAGPKNPDLRVPKLVRNVMPSYTTEGIRAKIQGTVEMRVVVLPNGTVGAIRILKSLDDRYGLDNQAVEAAARWFFEPGTLNGTAVATTVTIVLEFRLR
jgi:TonB family protein